jgi:DNA recombination protein RmuC
MIISLVFAIVGVLIGLLAGFVLGRLREKTRSELSLRSAETRAAAEEARANEIRRQNELTKNDLTALQEKFRTSENGKIMAETHALESEKNLAEQKALLEEAKGKLSDTFKALASEVLAGNNVSFLTLAQEKFKTIKEEATVDLDSRKKAMDALIGPLSETLSLYQKESRALEEKRVREITSVGEQLRSLAVAQNTLQSETTKLVFALKSSVGRGRWGEITLRRIAELSGMSPYCDFVEQESITTEDGRFRPDMIVKLPAGREVIVDSKVPLGGFLESLEAKTEEDREVALKKYAGQVKQHIANLSSKEYWNKFSASFDCVVLFIPNDSFLSAAVDKDPNLIESALAKKVIVATPSTLIALLQAFAYGWRQEQITENAQKISALGQELSERMGTLAGHLIKVGESLGRSVGSYNDAVASFEGRVLPSARKFKTLGAGGKKDIEDLLAVDKLPRPLAPIED